MTKALIIVDVQNDFVEGGSLGVDGGLALAGRIAEKLNNESFTRMFDYIVTTQDWHIEPGDHFAESPDYVDSWPVHCLAEDRGSEFAPLLDAALQKTGIDIAIKKGMYEAAYSGFEGIDDAGVSLVKRLKDLNVTEVTVIGIATEHCVTATALDANEAGFKTVVWSDYCVGIDDERCSTVLDETLPNAGIQVI